MNKPLVLAIFISHAQMWPQVELFKPTNRSGLGFSIVDGKDVVETQILTGIYVNRVVPGGVADMSGQILPGDQVVQASVIGPFS
ncbi:unnamed protein product [Protopolystoma xenopodis]|uniref:PDZ domain-containing protein n=1 Tax=Protopolystoma xenopodis TaxID=117903 RepID=A0A448XMW9_9PLAT|nr:unnamed protein product [Protopolystoma xenopodis]